MLFSKVATSDVTSICLTEGWTLNVFVQLNLLKVKLAFLQHSLSERKINSVSGQENTATTGSYIPFGTEQKIQHHVTFIYALMMFMKGQWSHYLDYMFQRLITQFA